MIAEALLAPVRFAARSWDPVHPRDPVLAKMFGVGRKTAAGVHVDEDKALAIPTVLRGTSIIANRVSTVARDVYQVTETGLDPDKGHFSRPFVRLDFNDEMLADDAIETMQSWAILRGNAVAWINRDGGGRPTDIIPLLPDRTGIFRISRGSQQTVEHSGKLMYWTRVENTFKTILPENVLHIRGYSKNGLWGMDIVDLFKETLGGDLATREHGHRFFGQGGTHAGFVTIPKGLDPEAEERLIKSLQMTTGGLGKSHKYVILEEGQQVMNNSISNNDSQFLESKEFNVRDIANLLRIQAEKVGDRKHKSYSSLEQASQEHKDDDIMPWLCKWSRELSKKLLTTEEYQSESHIVGFDDSELEWVPFRDRVEAARKVHLSNLADQDESRSICGLKPRKEKEKGSQFFIPANHVPTDHLGKKQSKQAKPDQNMAELTKYEIDRIQKRLQSIALKKSESELVAWVDDLDVNQGPECLRDQIKPLMTDLKTKFQAAFEVAIAGDDLKPVVESIFAEVFKESRND